MFKKWVEMYQKYKDYVRVDLIMYAVMILMIIVYAIYIIAFP
jgi:di/tricarboxylate transporter